MLTLLTRPGGMRVAIRITGDLQMNPSISLDITGDLHMNMGNLLDITGDLKIKTTTISRYVTWEVPINPTGNQ